MEKGVFCFLSDEYYIDFPDDKLMKNKETIDGILKDRPCFFAFQDRDNKNIFWLVPVSSKASKYRLIAEKKIEKYGNCNTIRFGDFLGREAAFLIQNMCPATNQYIREIYFNKNNELIQIDNRIVKDIEKNAKEVLAKVKRGAKIIFPDVVSIYEKLNQK